MRYLLVEIATGAAFALVRGKLGLTLPALKYAIYSAIMIALIASDIEERILPDEFTLGGTVVGLVFAPFVPLEHYFAAMFIPYSWGERWQSLGESAFAAAVGSGSIWLVGWLYEKLRHREGLGFGDVKMIAMIGAFVGLRLSLMTLILASIAGSVLGLAYIKLTQKDAATYELPFGSFSGCDGAGGGAVEQRDRCRKVASLIRRGPWRRQGASSRRGELVGPAESCRSSASPGIA